MSRLRIGFVGAGSIVRTRHFPNLQKIDGLDFVSVCNSSQDSSERAAQEMGLSTVFTDWRELVEDNDIDIVWIGTWPYLHCPITLAALEAGKHVFCQARMAMNLAEAIQMLDASRRSDRVTMLCPPPMGLKGDAVMRQLIADGVLGDVYSLHFRDISPSFANPNAPIHWRQRRDLSGFNTLTVGIYAEVIHRWFGYAKSVTAEAKTFIPERPDSEGGRTAVTRPDVVLALTEMENGALMRWEWTSLASCEPISVLEAFGGRGSLCYDFIGDEILVAKEGREWEAALITPENERLWTVEQDFIAAVREGKDVHPNFEDGVKYMELTEAVFRSVESGRRIDLPLV
ncbi:MAG: Gfo/Idh/MocA family oxidoreductase [Candidatus Omnitrophica bacterium]|nr:Gfo/Idh/MocA family oxidoreductase [Candidatus Omnitrophota bacterium]